MEPTKQRQNNRKTFEEGASVEPTKQRQNNRKTFEEGASVEPTKQRQSNLLSSLGDIIRKDLKVGYQNLQQL